MERQEKKKAIKMATTTTTTLGYNLPNRESSSPSSPSPSPSPTLGQRSTSDQLAPAAQIQVQGHTLVFNNPIQSQNSINNNNNNHNHHHVYGSPSLAPVPQPQQQQQQQQQQQSERTSTDPDLISSTAGEDRRIKILYRECLRNHAASMGSHVVDGCGEFMPSGVEGTPESLKCAACECHRNFHRKEIQGEQSQPQPQQQHVSNPYYPSSYPNKHNNGHLHFSIPTPTPTPPSPLSLPHQQHRFSHVLPTPTAGVSVPPLMMAFGGGLAAESSSEDLNMFQCNQAQPLSKKRFRTKFSQQQKDRMMEFAEKIGWKIQKHDEQEVQQFCSQLGIKRQIFKVWMHNNKQAMKKTVNV